MAFATAPALFYRLLVLLSLGDLLAPAARAQRGLSRPTPPLPARPDLFARARAAHAARRRPGAATALPTREMTYYWEPASQEWLAPYLQTYRYDAAGRRVETLSGDSLRGPLGVDRDLLTFDARGNLTEQLIQERDTSSLPWTNLVRSTTTYDAHDETLLSTDEVWDNGAWLPYAAVRATNVYTTFGQLSERTLEEGQQNVFVPHYRFQYTYGPDNHTTAIVSQKYLNGIWTNQSRTANLVWQDWTAQQPASYTEQFWDGSAWIDEVQSRAAWQPNGSFVHYEQWLINGQWQDFNRFIATFDELGNVLADSWEQYDNGAWVYRRALRGTPTYSPARDATLRRLDEQYDEQQAVFLPTEKHLFGRAAVLAAHPPRPAAVRLFPNPAHHSATLVLEAAFDPAQLVLVQVLNPLGQVVCQQQVRAQADRLTASLDVRGLPAGVYTVRAATRQGPVSCRLVRE